MDKSVLINAEKRLKELVEATVDGKKVNFTFDDIVKDFNSAIQKEIEEKAFNLIQDELSHRGEKYGKHLR